MFLWLRHVNAMEEKSVLLLPLAQASLILLSNSLKPKSWQVATNEMCVPHFLGAWFETLGAEMLNAYNSS